MKRFLLVLGFMLPVFMASASHIVGGEFELSYLSGTRYRLRMILYFDNKNGSQGAKSDWVDIRIFSKRTNAIMQTERLVWVSEESVSYTQPDCSNGEIETLRIVYESEITLSESRYNDSQGYYIAWERCCRNYNIVNVFSQNPNNETTYTGLYAGQTFYLEFPPVVKDGKPFINSTPRLFPPLNDYACPNKLYYVDFAGVDDDGDSLVYSLVTPLNTLTADALPPDDFLPRPGPYPNVLWQPGFGINNIVKGNPDLSISPDGFLRVVPTMSGIFVFAVKCEEYRNNVKIGEVRRDFQMFVVDSCPVAEAPEITASTLNSDVFTPSLNISFDNTVTDEDRCIRVKVTDADAFKSEDNLKENITIKAIPIGFKSTLAKDVLPAVTKTVLTPGNPEHIFNICFDECPLKPDGHFKIGVIAYDDACSLPLSDTVVLDVFVEPRENLDPVFTSDDVNESVPEGIEKQWTFTGTDFEGDDLEIELLSDFDLSAFGMRFEKQNGAGIATGVLTWDPKCTVYNFREQQDFTVQILLKDNMCLNEPDTLTVDLYLDIPPNTAPTLTVTSTNDKVKLENNQLATNLGQPITLQIVSNDPDLPPQDFVSVELMSATGTVSPQGYMFTPASGNNTALATFSWAPACEIFTGNNYESDFLFTFRTFDNSCLTVKGDTVEIAMKIKDVDQLKEYFLPPNLITPNGDGKNDFFGLEELDDTGEEMVKPNLPLDNCAEKFLSIQIFNRWGKKVFESDKRNFRWYANNQATGIYYYTVTYTHSEYKGTIDVKY